MNSFSQVESTLKEILDVIKPLREDWVTRFKIIDELREVVQSMESLRGATVEPFGSFVSNLFTRSGDLDISIELPYGSFVSSAAKKRKLSLLGEILRALRQTGRWQRLQFIPHARVPILKIESKWQNISCDISIDNLQGQIKSKFMFWLNEIDGRFREMVLLVKEWAKAHGINNPKTGTFNSYSLSLLVIFHFQTCVPAIFPPLKDIYPGNVVDDLTGVRADAERRIAEVCSSNIARFKSGRLLNRSSLAELFISFIAKFSDIDSKASVMGICPFRGQWDYITSNTRWLPQTYAIFIEDPFEQPVNAARAVSQKQLITISDTFETTRPSQLLEIQWDSEAFSRSTSTRITGWPFTFGNAAIPLQERKALNLTSAASSSEDDVLNFTNAESNSEYAFILKSPTSISESKAGVDTLCLTSATSVSESEGGKLSRQFCHSKASSAIP
ncbi:putative zinc finger protein [Corchorus capsularis]|uniref:Putative zinc finger protein n=1 Tax=Corchorus capsularis TaxID=210143 RepID=A0A1R3GM40_COCAP|nr:putative zinc finger protein [Corchorus capsularis]